ncbi:Synaptic vesicle transporter SVOP [Lecanora helva]
MSSTSFSKDVGMELQNIKNTEALRRSVTIRVEDLGIVEDGLVPDDVAQRFPGQSDKYLIVRFSAADQGDPKNWSKTFKWYCTMVIAFTCFVVTFNSSVVTADISGVSKEFGVSDQVTLLTVTMLVLGFGIGPLIFAPLSEAKGRKIVYAGTLTTAVISISLATSATSIYTLLVARTIDGVALGAPMTLVGGTLADLWKAEERSTPMIVFSAAPSLGAVIGPLAGGFLAMSHGWRWLYWIQLIVTSIALVLITFTVPETYAPTILAGRAAKLRKETKDPRYIIEQDVRGRTYLERVLTFLTRPFQLLFQEPIVLFTSIYVAIVYGLMYMLFVAYPIVYRTGKGYNASTIGLMFIPMGVGILLGTACAPLVNMHYLKLCRQYHGKPPAEVRLIPMMFACWFIPIGVFIFAWTSYPNFSWIGPAMGGMPFGFGFLFLYNSANIYIVDAYQQQAASALAAVTFFRCMFGSTTVLYTAKIYEKLGFQWASSLIGFVSLGCCAIPFMFYAYGARFRLRSKYAHTGEDE